jgi:hypothetical protein
MKIVLDEDVAGFDQKIADDAKRILSAAMFGKPAAEAFEILDTYIGKKKDREAGSRKRLKGRGLRERERADDVRELTARDMGVEDTDDAEIAEKLLDAMEYFLRDILVGRYADVLVMDAEHRRIAARMKDRKRGSAEACVAIVEDARMGLRMNGINKRVCLRDMVLKCKMAQDSSSGA